MTHNAGLQKKSKYCRVTLDNGIRVVTEHIPFLQSVSLGIWVNAGSRDELPNEAGVSHVLEHMFFKGTSRRSADTISREIDQMGGELNAFTSRETTTFYLHVLDEDLTKALSILTDVFQNSKFSSHELKKEKQVILEELRMVEDDAEDYIHDIHTANVLKNHPLGRPIIGTKNTIHELRRSDLLNYRIRHYHPEKIVIAVAGQFNHAKLIRTLSRTFGRLPENHSSPKNRCQPAITPGVIVRKKNLTQAHICLGMKGLPRGHKDRYALSLVNTMLGGSVSSRLFLEIREKRGLVYSIYSSLSHYEDIGLFTIYAATQADEAPRVISLIGKELRKIQTRPPNTQELKHAKSQLKGSIALNLEGTSSRMTKLARDEMYVGNHVPLAEIMSSIDHVKNHDIERVINEISDTASQTLTVLGPLSKKSLQSAI